jgi:maltooligosyltrehalose trehalohydrolase
VIRVWAPVAERVEIDLPGRGRHPMVAEGGGWWLWEELHGVRDAVGETEGTGLDYAFVLDGVDPALPDPRSPWQPHGVHGPSRTFDAGAFPWTDDGWAGPQRGEGVLGGVFYELHVGTFTAEGTLDAAIGRLGHLQRLGVDVVELMPVAAFPGRWNWGYDGVALWAVDEAYGGPAALQRFVDACHARGIGVCLDVVYNHLGPEGNYLARFGPYFTDRHLTPWGPAVNFDGAGSGEVRAFVVDAAVRWFRDFHVDALRLDAVHELFDDSEQHVLTELAGAVDDLATCVGRPLALMAESDLNDATTVTPVDDGGVGMTGQWSDDVHHALHVALTGETEGYYTDFAASGALAKTLSRAFFHDGNLSTFRGRRWGAPIDREAVDGRRMMAYLQTHDQVGNRATGDRISATVTPGQQAIGAALYLTSAFTPMVFMGEEWAASSPFQFFTDFGDPRLREAVGIGRRAEFASHGWAGDHVPDPQDVATRSRSVLCWGEVPSPPHARMLTWYAALTALRHKEADLRSGDLQQVEVRHEHDSGWLVMRRGSIVTAANLSAHEQVVPLPDVVSDVLASWSGATRMMSGPPGIRLSGHDVAVLRLPPTEESAPPQDG